MIELHVRYIQLVRYIQVLQAASQHQHFLADRELSRLDKCDWMVHGFQKEVGGPDLVLCDYWSKTGNKAPIALGWTKFTKWSRVGKRKLMMVLSGPWLIKPQFLTPQILSYSSLS